MIHLMMDDGIWAALPLRVSILYSTLLYLQWDEGKGSSDIHEYTGNRVHVRVFTLLTNLTVSLTKPIYPLQAYTISHNSYITAIKLSSQQGLSHHAFLTFLANH